MILRTTPMRKLRGCRVGRCCSGASGRAGDGISAGLEEYMSPTVRPRTAHVPEANYI